MARVRPNKGHFAGSLQVRRLTAPHPYLSKCTYAMVHGGFDTGQVRLVCPYFHSQWTPGMNSCVLTGFQPQAAHLGSHTPTNLLWVLFSSVRGTGYVGHALVSCMGNAKMTIWHTKVLFVWISECQGNHLAVVKEAMRRPLGGGSCVLVSTRNATVMGGSSQGFGALALAFYSADLGVIYVTVVGHL